MRILGQSICGLHPWPVSYTHLDVYKRQLDATAGTYMRPADRVPNVYSHIVLEYFDDAEDKSFLLLSLIHI